MQYWIHAVMGTCLALVGATVGWAQFSGPVPYGPSLGPVRDLVAGDVDGDGREDFLFLDPPSTSVSGMLSGSGNLTPVELANWTGSLGDALHLADLNGDGRLDVLVGTSVNLVWLQNQGSGVFASPVELLPLPCTFVTSRDLDSDGDLDLVTIGANGSLAASHLSVAGTYSTTFTNAWPTNATPHQWHWSNLDGDGDPDLVIGFFSGPARWIEFDSSGTLFSVDLGMSGQSSLVSADVDRDGDVDLVSTSRGQNWGWAENLGHGTFGPLQIFESFYPSVVAPIVQDLDGDGWLDVAAVTDLFSEVTWVRGLGAGSFGAPVAIDSPPLPDALFALDLNQDGARDLVVARNSNGFARLWVYENQHTLGATVCTGQPHSLGGAAELTARGSIRAATNQVNCRLSNAPAGQFAVLLNSRTTGMSQPAGSMGTLCLAQPVGFYRRFGEVGFTSAQGDWALELDLLDTPLPTGSAAILSGETWHFQAWFRDRHPGPTSNFSSATALTFL